MNPATPVTKQRAMKSSFLMLGPLRLRREQISGAASPLTVSPESGTHDPPLTASSPTVVFSFRSAPLYRVFRS